MQTKDAQSTVASTTQKPGEDTLVPIWQQLPERSLAAFVERDLPFQMVVIEQGNEVARRVDTVIDYPPAVGAQFVPVTPICIDPGKFSNKAGGIRQREIIEIDGTPVEQDAPPRFVSINEPVVYKPAEQASYIDSLVAAGTYASTSEVVRAGLRALQERDAALEDWLRDEVAPIYGAMMADPARAIPADQVFEAVHDRI